MRIIQHRIGTVAAATEVLKRGVVSAIEVDVVDCSTTPRRGYLLVGHPAAIRGKEDEAPLAEDFFFPVCASCDDVKHREIMIDVKPWLWNASRGEADYGEGELATIFWELPKIVDEILLWKGWTITLAGDVRFFEELGRRGYPARVTMNRRLLLRNLGDDLETAARLVKQNAIDDVGYMFVTEAQINGLDADLETLRKFAEGNKLNTGFYANRTDVVRRILEVFPNAHVYSDRAEDLALELAVTI